MSSKRFAAPLRLELRPSRRLTLYFLTIHSAAFIAVWLTPFPRSIQILAAFIVVLCLLHGIDKHVRLRHPQAVISIVWDAHGEWHVALRNGSTDIMRLRDGCFCHPQLVVLNFRRPDFPWLISVAVFPDSLPTDTFRRLRVRLKLEAGAVRDERYI